VLFLPRGLPHQLSELNGHRARYTILCTPSGFENFVAQAGSMRKGDEGPSPPTAEEIERLTKSALDFGIKLLPGF
jgi:hypothetical protein